MKTRTKRSLILAGALCCSLALGGVTLAVREAKAEENATVYSNDFETELGFEASGATPLWVEQSEFGGCAHSGEKAMKVTGIWSRHWLQSTPIESGKFYEVGYWTKKADAAADTQTVAELYIWGCDEDGQNGWVMCNTRIRAVYYTNLTDEYQYVSGVFGVYSDTKAFYAYHDNGATEILAELEGKILAPQSLIDVGVTAGGSAYIDDFIIKPLRRKKMRRSACLTATRARRFPVQRLQ